MTLENVFTQLGLGGILTLAFCWLVTWLCSTLRQAIRRPPRT